MTRGYGDFWQGASIDRVKLAQTLPLLLDTADELKAVAGKLGAPALTLPKQPTELDDGLLAAGEVAQLKLNADGVVHSACNTAAAPR